MIFQELLWNEMHIGSIAVFPFYSRNAEVKINDENIFISKCGTFCPILPFWETYQNHCKQLPDLSHVFREQISKVKNAL